MSKSPNRYLRIIEAIFRSHYSSGCKEFVFKRDEIVTTAKKLRIATPKNIGDLVYALRYRTALPPAIVRSAPKGKQWMIRAAGPAKYRFVLVPEWNLVPNPQMLEVKVPDSTPGIIEKYALSDEQALLAKLRYNRLVDVFSGLTCYSLQNHLRTSVADMGQVETDEIYVGVDRQGAHYVLPVQAKGGSDKLSLVQIEQDFALAAEKFPDLVCRAIAAQFMAGGVIALFLFSIADGRVGLASECHYKLVPADQVTADDLRLYRSFLDTSAKPTA
jgi:hypothetical protein